MSVTNPTRSVLKPTIMLKTMLIHDMLHHLDKHVPSEVKKFSNFFKDAGFEIRIVGGWVRDIQSCIPKDIDLATDATPEQIIELCNKHNIKYIETGIQHGTITVFLGAISIEVTTLRIDISPDGRHSDVEFTTDWKIDAARRDFTINAMSVGFDGTLYDYFGGFDDLSMKKVRFVGNAIERIKEDYLRILRYFRFRTHMLDASRDHDTFHAIIQTADGLTNISVERIWTEMSKILSGDSLILGTTLADMMDTNVFKYIGLEKVERYDLVNAIVTRYRTMNPLTVLAAMTNEPIASLWKMSNNEKKFFNFALSHKQKSYMNLKDFQIIALNHSKEWAIEIACLLRKNEILNKIETWDIPVFPIKGQDLIDIKNFKSGPNLGKSLQLLRQYWIDSDFNLTKNDLLSMI
jgi:tRNA nucleotidyltransferase (CCA-adding enzyme)